MTDCVIMDDHVRKIYIDSPIFTHEDEERFRYISTNVDDAVTGRTNADELETLIEDALGPPMKTAVPTGGNARSYQDRSPRPFDSLDDEEVAIGRAPGGPIDLSRYEDFNGDRVNHYDQFIYDPAGLPQEPHPPRFRQERPSPGSQPGHMAMQRMNKDVNDIQPFTGQDEAEDYAEARLERQRQHRQARQAHVPQLDLIESEDETGDGRAALDLELNEGRMSHVSKFSHNHGGPQSNSVHGYKHPNEHSQSTQQTAGQKYFGRQQQPVRNSENHPDGDYVQDSLEVAQTYRRLGDNGGNPYYARTLIGDNYGAGNTVPPNHLQDEYAPNTRPMRQMVSNERPPHSNTGSAVSSAAGSRVLNRHNHLPPSSNFVPETAVSEQEHTERDNNTGPDFIEANRQNVKKPLKTYGQIYSRRKGKENAETNEMPTRRQSESDSYRRPDKVTGHPATADERRTLSQQQVAENGTSGEQSDLSAEHLWHARSRILAAKKEAGSVGGSSSSATSKSRRRDTAPPLHKYPSDTQMETGPSLMPSTGASSAPYQRSAGSYGTAAAMAAHPPSPQKVSVDINLNVISPRNSLNQPSAMQFRLGGQHGGGHPDGGRGQVYDGVPSVSHVSVAAQPQTYHLVSSTGFVSPSAVYSGTLPMQAVGDGGHYVISQQPPFVGPFVMPQHNHNDVYLAANGGSRMAFQDQPNNLQQAYLPIRYSYNMPQPMVAQPMQSAHHYQYQTSGQHPYSAMPTDTQSRPQLVRSPQMTSPYRVLPPVGSPTKDNQETTQQAHQPATELWTPKTMAAGGGSYMDQYRRLKKRSDYKQYTIDDYRKLQKEIRLNLGSLGPDMDSDTLKERKEKAKRQQEYARVIQERNKLEHLAHPSKPAKSSQDDDAESDDQANRRRAALEYAKNIPKPKMVPRSADASSTAKGSSLATESVVPGASDAGFEELQRLKERHQFERQQVALLLHNNGY